jgi:hypothetical protein
MTKIISPPGFRELQRRISKLARDRDEPVQRLYQLLATEVFFNILEEARERGIIDDYAIKGGMALEVRFGMRARASRDVDVSFPIPFESVPAVLDTLLVVGFAGFTARRKAPLKALALAQTYRADIEIQYAGNTIFRLDADVNGSIFEPAVDVVTSGLLPLLGLPGPVNVSLIDIHTQLAHKIHGATQPSIDGYRNVRYRDALDALIIAENEPLDYERVRMMCRAEFGLRGTHGWPPALTLDEDWRAGLEAEAAANDFAIRDAQGIADRFASLIDEIEGNLMSEVLETKLFVIKPDELAAVAQPRAAGSPDDSIAAYLERGWQVATINLDLSPAQRAYVVLERRRALVRIAREVPRLQARLVSKGMGIPTGQRENTPLEGILRNVGAPANFVRVIIPGIDQDYSLKSTTRFGTVTAGDELPFSVDCKRGVLQVPDQTGPWELAFEYEDDAGQKYRQVGEMLPYASANNVRLFEVAGLGGAVPIASYSASYNP